MSTAGRRLAPEPLGIARQLLQDGVETGEEGGAIVVPVRTGRLSGREPGVASPDRLRLVPGQGIGLVEARGDRSVAQSGQAGAEGGESLRFSVVEKHIPRNGAARLQPVDQFGRVRVARVVVHVPDASPDLDVVALDPDRGPALDQQPSERARGLEAGDQNGDLLAPQQALQMASDTAGVAHAAARQDHMPAAQPFQPIALLRPQEVMEPGGMTQRLERIVAGVRVPAAPEKDFRRLDGQGRVEEYFRRQVGLGVHHGQQIEDQFLGPADGEGRHEQGAARGLGGAHLFGQRPTPRRKLQIDALPVAVGAFQDNVIHIDGP